MIVSLSGKKRSGKDTVAQIIQYLSWKKEFSLDTEDSYEEMMLCSGADLNTKYSKQSFANAVNYCFAEITGERFDELGATKETYRPKFIAFAESAKKIFGDDVWVRALMRDAHRYGYFIITDTRFQVEFEELRKKFCIFVHVARDGVLRGISKEDEIEEYLDSETYNIYIENNGTFNDLIKEVRTKCSELL